MHYTYYGANSWLWDFSGCRVLVDPWLVGSLVFGNMPWLFKGDRPKGTLDLPDNVDVILLSQGLPDHAHRPTLEVLDHAIPVIASPSGAKVAKELGYQTVVTLDHGDSYIFNDILRVEAFAGAPVGLQTENGYLITDLESSFRLYYEPHGYPPASLEDAMEPVDMAISPVLNLELPLAGPIIQGDKTAIEIAKALKPRLFLPTAVGGDVEYSGVLDQILSSKGSVEQLEQQLSDYGLSTQVISPSPYEQFDTALVANT